MNNDILKIILFSLIPILVLTTSILFSNSDYFVNLTSPIKHQTQKLDKDVFAEIDTKYENNTLFLKAKFYNIDEKVIDLAQQFAPSNSVVAGFQLIDNDGFTVKEIYIELGDLIYVHKDKTFMMEKSVDISKKQVKKIGEILPLFKEILILKSSDL